MQNIISRLLIYGDTPHSDILLQTGNIFSEFQNIRHSDSQLIRGIFNQIRKLLILATDYGFDNNLWQNYLTFLLITDENPFAVTCEKTGAGNGTVNEFAMNDFANFRRLFHYDFSEIENALGIDCFSKITHYTAVEKKELMYNRNVSEKVQTLSNALANAVSDREFFQLVTQFYHDFGVGMFGLNKAFRIVETEPYHIQLKAINNMDKVMLDDLIGYERQKQQLVQNTKAFVEGRKANNTLLFGDSGTGKSTSIKAVVNEFYPQGLRMIEIYKHQFKNLSDVISQIKNRNYKFIIYMDDLSFEDFETEYKYLKAVIEGGVETKPDNILIYATSNRRHLIKETWNDRNDMEYTAEIHRSDTVEEKLSLVSRFGCTISYNKPSYKEYLNIVIRLAEKNKLNIPEKELTDGARQWELKHNGISGRTAQQYINYLLGVR